MKKIKLLAAVAMLTMVLFACKKDKSTPPVADKVTETPGKATLEAKVAVDSIFIGNPGKPSEIGSKIFFTKNGKITQLGGKFAAKGDFRVSFWKFDTKDLIVTVTVNVTDTSKFTYANITPINIAATTAYVISMNNSQDGTSKDVFAALKKPDVPVIYPFTTGSVVYQAFLGTDAVNPTFPTSVISDHLFTGITDFVFEPEQ